MTPKQDTPARGEVWSHHSGRRYIVLMLTNTAHPSDKFPPAVVYRNVDNDTVWSRPLSDWHRSFGDEMAYYRGDPDATDEELNR